MVSYIVPFALQPGAESTDTCHLIWFTNQLNYCGVFSAFPKDTNHLAGRRGCEIVEWGSDQTKTSIRTYDGTRLALQ
jgi:hypothetical protein